MVNPNVSQWTDLQFNPVGLHQLRENMHVSPQVFDQFMSRFKAAELAWFASGTSCDNKHFEDMHSLHPMFFSSRQPTVNQPPAQSERRVIRQNLVNLLFDVRLGLTDGKATLLDRAFGGSTIIMHVEGTVPPNTPIRAEYLKALVYLPRRVIQSLAENDKAVIANMVQNFIRVIGIPTVSCLQTAVAQQGWRYMAMPSTVPQPFHNRDSTIPEPLPQSNRFIFLGQADTGVDDSPSIQSYKDENVLLKQLLEDSDVKIAELQHMVARLRLQLSSVQRGLRQEAPLPLTTPERNNRSYHAIPTSVQQRHRHLSSDDRGGHELMPLDYDAVDVIDRNFDEYFQQLDINHDS
ncbi:hypothetical protein M378DRAFT_182432 [Amanita muscaria Koide BX008]|uniref:Uncharacterized protein n=1 Tax=Amanita muscaria (strain Koide BX008) TaxID=946122 RepID=A0A0C2RW44_AMAMK|nr:hypothetical protein M378DRAFT_182534 [Amanita muscaria Koide BX008]KIL54721.1 hypothetical protein M378DRAFT_182432 [Amanita muscaria Koide BX008]